jgi:long-chain acyl-CoA synthetase
MTWLSSQRKPESGALTALNDEEWTRAAKESGLSPHPAGDTKDKAEKLVTQRIGKMIKAFPGYAQVRRVTVVPEKWTIDNGFMTPTLKFKRKAIFDKYRPAIDLM